MSTASKIDDAGAAMKEFAAELTSSAYEAAATLAAGAGARGSDRLADKPEVPGRNLDLILRIPVTMKVVLGSATMPVSALTKLQRGALVPLDRKVGDAVDIVVNGRVIAKGQVVVIDEKTSQFGVSLTEVGKLPGAET